MAERYEMRLSGEGGQGLVLAGKILAEAAAIYDDKNATQSQSYGPEVRGGASKSEVIVSDGAIDYPKAENLDLLLALTQESFDKYHGDLRPGGWLVVDAEAVTRFPDVSQWKLVPVPFEKLRASGSASPLWPTSSPSVRSFGSPGLSPSRLPSKRSWPAFRVAWKT